MPSKRPAVVAAVLAGMLMFAACGGSEEASPQAKPTPTPTPTPDPTCPLTGEAPAPGVALDRPAVAVKIENPPEARPQAGLASADVVFEERVEGGITRFMAIYHCDDVEKAGPVRSGRFDDGKLASPFTTLLAASGSNGIVTAEIQDRGITYLTEGSTEGLFREGSSVHSLFANTKLLRKAAVEAKIEAPLEGIFTFGEIANKAKKAKVTTMHFTPSNTIEYRWEAGAWARYEAGAPFLTSEGDQIKVPNVLVQLTKIDNSNTIVDVAGNPSPELTLVGSGKLLLFRDGKVIKGTWEIAEEGGAPVYTDKNGDPLVFATGPIWIELIPSEEGEIQGDVSFSKKLQP